MCPDMAATALQRMAFSLNAPGLRRERSRSLSFHRKRAESTHRPFQERFVNWSIAISPNQEYRDRGSVDLLRQCLRIVSIRHGVPRAVIEHIPHMEYGIYIPPDGTGLPPSHNAAMGVGNDRYSTFQAIFPQSLWLSNPSRWRSPSPWLRRLDRLC